MFESALQPALRVGKLGVVLFQSPPYFVRSERNLDYIAYIADIAYVRFHGRNTETWFKKKITTAERFAYLYDDAELSVWAPRLKSLSAETARTYGMFNNCYADYGVRNARRMGELLGIRADDSTP